jgi:hypothetical protein
VDTPTAAARYLKARDALRGKVAAAEAVAEAQRDALAALADATDPAVLALATRIDEAMRDD